MRYTAGVGGTEILTVPASDASEFEALLDCLKGTGDFDPRAYKRTSLARRLQQRMRTVGVAAYGEYQKYLDRHPDELAALLNTILINVTGFFRDPPAWSYLAEVCVPYLLSATDESDVLRVWSAGCAAGQEPYSVAMVMAEALGVEKTRERVKIFATDADGGALVQARQALYTESDVSGVPTHLRERYFARFGDQYLFHPGLRDAVIFGQHDLVRDPPMARLDLLVCRNTLMYFHLETQKRVLGRFHFALNNGGVLFLGKAESLHDAEGAFRTLDPRLRIYTRTPHRWNIPPTPL